jgi:DNA helicase-2/ATP-dependent DNA helicase PcrA
MTGFLPRPNQAEILNYRGGKMGVSAVPGSGKTWTLSRLAAELIREGGLKAGQEVLVVTMVNSAVDNFSRRINDFIAEDRFFRNLKYKVRTLHGLANDIVRERPGLVGLADDFQIVDERESGRILDEAVLAWLRSHPQELDGYLAIDPDENENRLEWLRRDKLPDVVRDAVLGFIRMAKDSQLDPDEVAARLAKSGGGLPLAEMCAAIYQSYQRALTYRGAVDFDDLIRLGLNALQADPDYLERLRFRWPYILEDEAQDSSRLQEIILRTLAGGSGNWVRVGDPNQAIYESFSTAKPDYLRDFIAKEADLRMALPDSGRSSESIIQLANHLISWTQTSHPEPAVRNALSQPFIRTTPAGDPQPNPEDRPERVELIGEKLASNDELDLVAHSAAKWVANNPEGTVAVLVPINDRGNKMVDRLRKMGLEPNDSLLRSSTGTRLAAGALANVLNYLADPKSARKLARVYQVWRRGDREEEEQAEKLQLISGALEKLPRVEEYLWPMAGRDWLQEIGQTAGLAEWSEELALFREYVQRWQGAVTLPVDQLVLTVAQDLFASPAELALSHKLAGLLQAARSAHPEWGLPEMTEELSVIAKNERRFLGFSDEDQGFEPDRYKGQVVVATMHKAKGLEWDRVYLMSVNNYDFPSAQQNDRYIAEKWFIRDGLNLQAEAIAQLKVLTNRYRYQEGDATRSARLDYVRERIRLLFVGITRARQELMVTWNTGRKGELLQAIPFAALQAFAQEQGYGRDE